jgi:hypothetical protein
LLYTEQSDDDKRYIESTARDAREWWIRMFEAKNKRKNANNSRRKFTFASR